jgi:DNA-directed RNA polymerase specialized sigma24 family protein
VSARSLEDMPDPAVEEVDPLAIRERSERLTALVNCLETLDEEKRAVVLLACYRGLSGEAPQSALGGHCRQSRPGSIAAWHSSAIA